MHVGIFMISETMIAWPWTIFKVIANVIKCLLLFDNLGFLLTYGNPME